MRKQKGNNIYAHHGQIYNNVYKRLLYTKWKFTYLTNSFLLYSCAVLPGTCRVPEFFTRIFNYLISKYIRLNKVESDIRNICNAANIGFDFSATLYKRM